jgi:catechol 2,3-dioxygenase-like lactoylglutathione lyase family enzyme
MDRLNHVKIVSPDPDAIDRFLTEVLEVPAGWPLNPDAVSGRSPTTPVLSPARDAEGNFTEESVSAFRGASGFGGRITGTTESRQFQILEGERPHIWAIAVGTRNLERAKARCTERGIPVTEGALVPWAADAGIRYFFAEVGGIVFEVMRVEASTS